MDIFHFCVILGVLPGPVKSGSGKIYGRVLDFLLLFDKPWRLSSNNSCVSWVFPRSGMGRRRFIAKNFFLLFPYVMKKHLRLNPIWLKRVLQLHFSLLAICRNCEDAEWRSTLAVTRWWRPSTQHLFRPPYCQSYEPQFVSVTLFLFCLAALRTFPRRILISTDSEKYPAGNLSSFWKIIAS